MAKEITVTLTEKSHKHAEMMVHTIANPELVVLANYHGEWVTVASSAWSASEYFLCHPDHEKECLHWLNGGLCVVISKSYGFNGSECLSGAISWTPFSVFMDPESVIKIKQEPEYVKVSFEKASDAVKAWEDGELYIVSGENYTQLETAQEVLTYLYRLYRKVEKGEQ